MNPKYMQIAFEEAEKAWILPPNPFVGAIVVKDDEVIAQAHTQSYAFFMPRRWHSNWLAEKQKVQTLRDFRALFASWKDAALHGSYHQSRHQKGVFGIRDPNPKVNEDISEEEGHSCHAGSGIEVSWGFMEEEITRQNEYFLCRILKGRPFVTLKMALSLDGKFAAPDGSSKWISSAASRAQVHVLRQHVDCVLVGISTVLADDPLLTSRIPLTQRQPMRVVLDKELQLPMDCALIKSMDQAGLMVFHAPVLGRAQLMKAAILRNMGVELVPIGLEGSHFRLPKVLDYLHNKGFYSVLLESGGALASEFVRLRLVDKLLIYYGAKIIGGDKAALSSLDLGNIANAIKLDVRSCMVLDGDLVLEAYLK